MSRNPFLSFAAFAVAASMSFFFTACGPSTSCSAATCAGCCDAMGLCQAGVTSSACGERGAMCASCSVSSSCSAGRCSLGGVGGGVTGTGGGVTGTGGGASGGGSAAGGTAGGGAAGGGLAAGGGSAGSACDRAAPLIQSTCGALAATVSGQCQQLLGSSCASAATAWFDCLVAAPASVTCVAGNFGSTTACVARYQTLNACLNGGTGGGSAGGGSAAGGSAGGGTGGGSSSQLNQPCPNTAPLCAGTNLYCALNVTTNGTSDGVFASTGACRKTCSSEVDCGVLEDCCALRNASATVCLPSSSGICNQPASVCKANGQSCVNDTNCCSGKCSSIFGQCDSL